MIWRGFINAGRVSKSRSIHAIATIPMVPKPFYEDLNVFVVFCMLFSDYRFSHEYPILGVHYFFSCTLGGAETPEIGRISLKNVTVVESGVIFCIHFQMIGFPLVL